MKKNLKNLILLILTVSLLMCTTVAANYFEVFYEDPLDANKIKLAMGFDTSNYLYMPGLEVAQFHDAENAYLRAFLDTSFTGGLSLYLTNASEGLVSRWNRTDDSGFNLGFYPDVEEEIELELTDGGFIGASTGNLLIDGFQALTVMNPALHGASDTVFVEGTNADITFDSVEEDLSDAKGHGFTSVPVVRIQSTSNIELSNNKLTKTIYFAEIEETVEEEEEEESVEEESEPTPEEIAEAEGVEEEEPVKVCKETDNGNDPKNAGTTYLYYDGTKDAYVDFCDKDNLLHEYYCADSQSLTKDVIKCSGECLKGKCVSGSETTKTYRFLPAELLVIDVPSKLKIKNDVYSISIKNGEVVATKIDKIDKGPSEGTIDKKSSPKLEESRIDKPVAPKPKKSVARPKTFFSRLFTGRFSSLTGRAINIFPFLKKWRTIKTGTATPNKPAKPASATNKPDAPKPDMDFNKVVSLKNGAVLGDFKLVGTVVGPKKVKLGITCLKTEKAVKLKRHKKYLSVSTVANAAKPIKPASPAIGNPAKPIKPASPAIDNPAKPIKPAMPASRFSLRKLFQGISGRFFAID